MNIIMRDSDTLLHLTEWFTQQLDQENIHFDDEPLSYDGNSEYDIHYYQMQKRAALYWRERYGFEPTPGQLMKGFFGAEFERSRRQRLLNQPWLDTVKEWCLRSTSTIFDKLAGNKGH